MKNITKTVFLSLFFFVCFVQIAMAQLPALPVPGDGVNAYVPWVEILFGAFVTITGYLSSFIPGIKKISDKAWRITAIAIVGGSIFIIAGWSNAIPLFISYLIATKAYELFLKKIMKTPSGQNLTL